MSHKPVVNDAHKSKKRHRTNDLEPEAPKSKRFKSEDMNESTECVVEPIESEERERLSKKDKKHKKDKRDKRDKKDKRDKRDKKEKKDKKDKKKPEDKESKKQKTESITESANNQASDAEKDNNIMTFKNNPESTSESDDNTPKQTSSYGHQSMDPSIRHIGEKMSTENRAAGNMLSAVAERRKLLWGSPTTPSLSTGPTASRNDWESSKFSNSEDKSKFLRLMGSKHATVDDDNFGKDEKQEARFAALEQQYASGINLKKQSYSSKNKGL